MIAPPRQALCGPSIPPPNWMPVPGPERAERPSLSRLKNVLAATAYGIVFIVGYILFLNRHFAYAGFFLAEKIEWFFVVISLILAVAPITLHNGGRSVSSLIAAFVYLFIYVTTILTLALAMPAPALALLAVQLTFAFGMCLLLVADRASTARSIGLKSDFDLMPAILYLTVVTTALMVYNYRGYLSFVGYEDVYEQRFANAELGKGLFIRYGSSWLTNCLVPLCLAHGLLRKKWLYFGVGTVGCVIVYMATAAKSVMLFPLVFVGLYALLGYGRIYRSFFLLTVTLIVLMAISLCFEFNVISSLFWMRSIGNGGFMTMHYMNFFSDHPYTYYSHINIVGALTNFSPYDGEPIGLVVGRFFMSEDTSANAHFWATDGIAALGLPGVAIISVVLFGVMLLFDAVTRRHDMRFLLMVFVPFLTTLLNTSLFTALWSGGAIFLVAFFAISPTIQAGPPPRKLPAGPGAPGTMRTPLPGAALPRRA